jgi:prepilin-type N-terminal cleavage/methylation domain-containing protein
MTRRGFTLLEVVLAIAIVAIIAAIVQATFLSVISTSEEVRVSSEELRLRQFLTRSLQMNLTTAYVEPNYEEELFRFTGVDGETHGLPRDVLRFVSTAPTVGGMGLPGDLKEVRYEVADGDSALEFNTEEDALEDVARLTVVETPMLGGLVAELDEETSSFVPLEGYEAPNWDVPIRSFNLEYFDGTDWVDDWDSAAIGRLPWCVRLKINFAKTDEQLEAEEDEGYDDEEDPDFEMVVAMPAGLGGTQDARMFAEPDGVTTSEVAYDPNRENEGPPKDPTGDGGGGGEGT